MHGGHIPNVQLELRSSKRNYMFVYYLPKPYTIMSRFSALSSISAKLPISENTLAASRSTPPPPPPPSPTLQSAPMRQWQRIKATVCEVELFLFLQF